MRSRYQREIGPIDEIQAQRVSKCLVVGKNIPANADTYPETATQSWRLPLQQLPLDSGVKKQEVCFLASTTLVALDYSGPVVGAEDKNDNVSSPEVRLHHPRRRRSPLYRYKKRLSIACCGELWFRVSLRSGLE
jgi:hypothetical protein